MGSSSTCASSPTCGSTSVPARLRSAPARSLLDVYARLAAAGATIPAGSCPTVGIGGHALGGGMGLAGRAFGLASDHIVGATIATVDGHLLKADPDLLWALRGGGGGNFGVVTELVMRLHSMPRSAAHFSVSWPWSSANEAIAAWQAWAPHATDKVTSILHVNGRPSISANGQYLRSRGGAARAAQHAPGGAGRAV